MLENMQKCCVRYEETQMSSAMRTIIRVGARVRERDVYGV